MLVSSRKVLQKANHGRYAVGAFNVFNLESLQAVIEAAKRLKSPVIVQTTEKAINYAGLDYILSMMKVAEENKIPIVLHLDHGRSVDLILRCIKAGYSSVMFDGADLEYERNINITKRLANIAHKYDVSVEAELGEMTGIEDNIDSARLKYTESEDAKDFIEQTGCDALAVSIGNAHGAFKFKGTPTFDIKRLKEIKEAVKIPLVLHGGSAIPQDLVADAIKYGAQLTGARGVPDNIMKEAIKNGINKVNIDSDIRLAFHVAAREFLIKNPQIFDPRTLFGAGKKLVTTLIMHKMKLFGSAGKG